MRLRKCYACPFWRAPGRVRGAQLWRWTEEEFRLFAALPAYATRWPKRQRGRFARIVQKDDFGDIPFQSSLRVALNVDRQVFPSGRFARLADPAGNPIQLWELGALTAD